MISVIVASAGRPEMFRNMLISLRATTTHYDLEIVTVIDENTETATIASEFDVDVVDFKIERRGALWAWNRALQLSDGDIIIPAGDDQVFHDGWLDYALESHAGKLRDYGVVGMNDLAYDGNTQLATMLLFDRKYCKEQMGGVFAPPVYKYYNVDSEWNAKAKILDKFYWDERSIVEHLHSAHNKRPVDGLDNEKSDWTNSDNATFEHRKANGFPITWESVI